MEDFVADAIWIDAPPERVFSALLDPEEVVEWSGAREVRIAPAAGGEYTISRPDGSVDTGRVAELVPGERLRLDEWHFRRGEEHRGPMTVTFSLRPQDDGAWITVRQDGLAGAPGWEEFAGRVRGQWVRATVALKRMVEGI